jgi:hypothetical protein
MLEVFSTQSSNLQLKMICIIRPWHYIFYRITAEATPLLLWHYVLVLCPYSSQKQGLLGCATTLAYSVAIACPIDDFFILMTFI